MDKPVIFEEIPFQLTLEQLSASPHLYGAEPDDYTLELWEQAMTLVKPKAAVMLTDVQKDAEGKVCAVGGQDMSGPLMDHSLGKLNRAFVYVASCGMEVLALGEDDPMANAALLPVRMMALGAAIGYVHQQVQERFQTGKLAALNPGSLPEWPLTEQKKVFAILGDAPEKIGVRLTPSCFMFPTESSSGILFETEHEYRNCMICTRLDCVGRQAPYDKELAIKIRGNKR